jgi:heptaprenyl diphosphate synthase
MGGIMNVKKMTALSVSVAIAMLLSFIESQIPPLVAVPGVKIGLSNVVTVVLLYLFGPKEAGTVALIRVSLSALLFGSAVSFIYSLAGAVLSFLVMLLFKSLNIFSETGVSVLGGVSHNAGQIAVACIIMENGAISLYLPPLVISGTVTGAVIGIISALLVKRLKTVIK